jgi:hypothetical protein
MLLCNGYRLDLDSAPFSTALVKRFSVQREI